MGKRTLHRTAKTAGTALMIAAAAIMIMAIAYLYRIHITNEWQQHVSLPIMHIPNKKDSIIVFAPHSDDETLGAGGMLALAAEHGAKVHVVLITNGDGFVFAAMRSFRSVALSPKRFIDFAYRRQGETLSALRTLGIPKKDVTFLGYPDQGVARMWDTYWDSNTLYMSRATYADHSPYSDSLTPEAPYCGESLLNDIEKVLKQDKPTDVYIPHPADNHPDHYATYCFVTAAVEQLASEKQDWAQKIRIHTYIVHRGDWPTPKGDHPKESLAPPYALARSDTKWYTLPLTSEIAAMKKDAIRKYRTQTAVEKGFLMSFARTNEVFGDVPDRQIKQVSSGAIRVDGKPQDWSGIPPTVVDPIGDYLMADFSKGGDVRSIYICTDKKYLYVRLDCVKNLSRRLMYTLNFRGLNRKDTNDIFTINIKLPSYSQPDNLMWAYKGKTLEAAIPLKDIKFDSEAFVQVYTKWTKFTVDNTGWHGFELSPKLESAAKKPDNS